MAFGAWDLQKPISTATAIDRIIHSSVTLEFDGPSIRVGALSGHNTAPFVTAAN